MSARIWIGVFAHGVSMCGVSMVAISGHAAWGVLSVVGGVVLGWALGNAQEVSR